MKFGVFTVQLPEVWPEEAVRVLKETGYQGIEWRVASVELDETVDKKDWYWKNNKATLELADILVSARKVKEVCEAERVEIISLTTYLYPDQKQEIEKVLKAAQIMNCQMIRVNPYPYTGKEQYQTLFQRTREELRELERLAEKYQVQINLEIHMGNIIPSASAAVRLLEGLNPQYIGVIYDAGNMVHEGYEQYRMGFEILGSYLHHIHIKDARWVYSKDEEGKQYYKVEWCPIGEGVVDFEILTQVILDSGYKGYLSFEDFSNESSTMEKLKSNILFMEKLINEKKKRRNCV